MCMTTYRETILLNISIANGHPRRDSVLDWGVYRQSVFPPPPHFLYFYLIYEILFYIITSDAASFSRLQRFFRPHALHSTTIAALRAIEVFEMTRLLLIPFVCCIFSFTLLYQADAGPNDPVTIPDTALRAVIETKLGKTSGDTITESEMNSMTGQFSAERKGISDLTGLEHATGIGDFLLSYNDITDLSPLANLTQLTALNLRYNPITNISPLANLTNLQELRIHGNGRMSKPMTNRLSEIGTTQFPGRWRGGSRIAPIADE